MKVAILGDLHWGARSDSPQVIEYFNKFFSHVFFPELDKRNIKDIIQCGDLVDRRKFININTAHELHKNFSDPIIEREMSLDIIIGNHDTFYKGTNEINSLNILYRDAPKNIRYFDSPQEILKGDTDFLYLPWICDANEKQSFELIEKTKAKYLIGHLELSGFEMYKGHVADEGLDRGLFKKFDAVFTGHYHTRSINGNVSYVGTPYEIVWSDYNDPRGFIILDTNTGETEFIKNPLSLFHRITYDENKIDVKTFDYEKYRNSYVKIVVMNNKQQWIMDEFLSRFNKIDTIDLQVIDESIMIDTNVDVDMDQVEDTFSILNNYVDKIELPDKNKLRTEIIELYLEAMQLNKE
ncbi:MAG: metallophosphoesterase [Candidatus Levybacteria bacterium]|nr:metallophosphoesterase [Candidatus Levybacteria bacterium]